MTHNGIIPLVDLVAAHADLENELIEVFRASLRTAGFIGGPPVEQFEREFAQFCQTCHCVGVGNGTDALRFALMAAGVKPEEIVVTVPNTFIATVEAISQAGAWPDFVDIDELTYNMDPAELRKYLEERCERDPQSGRLIHRRLRRPVSAILPVHLYGQMADMDPIVELAERYQLIVIEDACQAHGAEYFSRRENQWKKAGSIGHAAAFSFYPGKNLGACGEAGAVTTNDEQIAARIRMLRNHGQSRKYFHEIEGYNGRLDTVQAGLLRVKLSHLAKWNEQRRERARTYEKIFAEANRTVILPHEPPWSRSVYHLYVVRVANRAQFQEDLTAGGVGTGIHYPIPLHLTKAYESLGFRPGDFPVTERAASHVLSLPMFPHLSPEQQERVAACASESIRGTGCQGQIAEVSGR